MSIAYLDCTSKQSIALPTTAHDLEVSLLSKFCEQMPRKLTTLEEIKLIKEQNDLIRDIKDTLQKSTLGPYSRRVKTTMSFEEEEGEISRLDLVESDSEEFSNIPQRQSELPISRTSRCFKDENQHENTFLTRSILTHRSKVLTSRSQFQNNVPTPRASKPQSRSWYTEIEESLMDILHNCGKETYHVFHKLFASYKQLSENNYLEMYEKANNTIKELKSKLAKSDRRITELEASLKNQRERNQSSVLSVSCIVQSVPVSDEALELQKEKYRKQLRELEEKEKRVLRSQTALLAKEKVMHSEWQRVKLALQKLQKSKATMYELHQNVQDRWEEILARVEKLGHNQVQEQIREYKASLDTQLKIYKESECETRSRRKQLDRIISLLEGVKI